MRNTILALMIEDVGLRSSVQTDSTNSSIPQRGSELQDYSRLET